MEGWRGIANSLVEWNQTGRPGRCMANSRWSVNSCGPEIPTMTGWDWAILIVVSYVALMSLVRLMIAQRDRRVAELEEDIARERATGKL